MSISSADIGGVADHLLGQPGEAFLRSATSRHYYCAFHSASAWLHALPGMHSVSGPAGGVRQQLINGLRAVDPSAPPSLKLHARKLAAKLDTMRARRVVADYQLAATVSAAEAADQARLAAEVAAGCSAP